MDKSKTDWSAIIIGAAVAIIGFVGVAGTLLAQAGYWLWTGEWLSLSVVELVNLVGWEWVTLKNGQPVLLGLAKIPTVLIWLALLFWGFWIMSQAEE